jgi:HD-GYP domain-containing protein (c-di-GMP phosphodiesterase class II)
MTETNVQTLLTALKRASSHLRLYGATHHISDSAIRDVASEANRLVGTARRAVISLIGNTVYLDGRPLAATSLSFNGMIRALKDHEIESVTFEAPVDARDCHELAALICGQGAGPAPGSTVTLNDDERTHEDVPLSGSEDVRSAYTGSVEALRAIGSSLRQGTGIDLTRSTSAVQGLLDQLVSQPGAAFLLTTMKSHHEYTFYHSVNTAIHSLALGRLAGLDKDDQLLLGMGALLHDIGKICIDVEILGKPGSLNPSDWAEIKRHPQLGGEAILAAAKPGQEASAIVAFEHHLRFDGLGYPATARRHLSRPLHFFSRLVAVTDTYDAITTRRSYRRAETPIRALSVLLNGAGTTYDPDFVHAFTRMLGIYPPGTLLRLRSGTIAMVTHPSDDPETPPFGVIVADTEGSALVDPEPVILQKADVVDQVLPIHVSIDPSLLLDQLSERELLAS